MSARFLVPLLLAAAACSSPRPKAFVNVSFTISYDTSHYRTWDFDLGACEDFPEELVDPELIRVPLLAAIEVGFIGRGYPRVTDGTADFLVSYEFWIEPEALREETEAPARGSIVVRDAETGQFAWRATRRAPIALDGSYEDIVPGTRRFTEDLLDQVGRLGAAIREKRGD